MNADANDETECAFQDAKKFFEEEKENFEELALSVVNEETETGSFKSNYAKCLADSYRRASLPHFLASTPTHCTTYADDFFSLDFPYFPRKNVGNVKTGPSSLDMLTCNNTRVSLLADPNVCISKESSVKSQNTAEFSRTHFEDKENQFYRLLYNLFTEDILYVPLKIAQEKFNLPADKLKLCYKKSTSEFIKLERSFVSPEYGCLVGNKREAKDSNSIINHLEGDLMRLRLECQKLLSENLSLKSKNKISDSFSDGTNFELEKVNNELKMKIEFLSLRLQKAEESRQAYEKAVHKLIDFLSTVNSTLSNTPTALQSLLVASSSQSRSTSAHGSLLAPPSYSKPYLFPQNTDSKSLNAVNNNDSSAVTILSNRTDNCKIAFDSSIIKNRNQNNGKSIAVCPETKLNQNPIPSVNSSSEVIYRGQELLTSLKDLLCKNEYVKQNSSVRPVENSNNAFCQDNYLALDHAKSMSCHEINMAGRNTNGKGHVHWPMTINQEQAKFHKPTSLHIDLKNRVIDEEERKFSSLPIRRRWNEANLTQREKERLIWV